MPCDRGQHYCPDHAFETRVEDALDRARQRYSASIKGRQAAAARKARERTRNHFKRTGQPIPAHAQIQPGLRPDLFKPRTSVTDTAHDFDRLASTIEKEPIERNAALGLSGCHIGSLMCDFCNEPCGPIVRLVVHRRLVRTRNLIWTSKSLADGGVLATAGPGEESRMKLDPLRTRRPVPRFGWGWVDRRIVVDGHLKPMSRTEILLYFFLCMVADRHGISWYGPRAMARLLKEPPDQLHEALTSLSRRNLVAVAGRFIQVLELDTALPVQPREASLSAPALGGSPARDELARLPHQQREELLRRARERMVCFLGSREPSVAALEAVAAGILRESGK